MDLHTDDYRDPTGAIAQQGENFLVARYSRDVLGRSQIGGLVINKQAESGGYYVRSQPGSISDVAADDSLATDLWERSETWVAPYLG